MTSIEYFATGIISPDDDVHAELTRAGSIPPTCRLGGPALSTLLPVITARALIFCDVCPFTKRELCGGRPKPLVSPLDNDEKKDFPLVDLSLTTNLAARMKRDVARAALIEGVTKVLASRKDLP